MKNKVFSLSSFANGTSGIIESVSRPASAMLDDNIIKRLNEIGFLPDEQVTVLRRGPGGHEPIAVQVGDTVFALRRVEADCVLVRALNNELAA